jgi:hypothetical protein
LPLVGVPVLIGIFLNWIMGDSEVAVALTIIFTTAIGVKPVLAPLWFLMIFALNPPVEPADTALAGF